MQAEPLQTNAYCFTSRFFGGFLPGDDEMHVDGGATEQLLFFSPEVPMTRVDRALGVPFDRTLYFVINKTLKKPHDPVTPRVLSIAGTATSSLISGSGTGDIYKIFAITRRDGMELKMLSIPCDFALEGKEWHRQIKLA